jgi:hypothetical protein
MWGVVVLCARRGKYLLRLLFCLILVDRRRGSMGRLSKRSDRLLSQSAVRMVTSLHPTVTVGRLFVILLSEMDG